MNDIYIVSAKRTPIGSFQGQLSNLQAPELGSIAIKAALKESHFSAEEIDECIMGNVLTAGTGQAPARQASLKAGLPNKTHCTTINKVCGSGLKSVMLAADSILLGHSRIVVAGGQENMTLAPHLLTQSRSGYRMGHIQAKDSMIHDGLWDPYNNFHMGSAAEFCAKDYKFSREEQDIFAKQSYEWAQKAQLQGAFKNEICTVETLIDRNAVSVHEDEEPKKARFDKIPTLKPAFDKDGTITAANASKINDGAAALVLCGKEMIAGKKPIAKIRAYATFAQEPKWFTTAPVGAIKMALEKAKLTTKDVDLWEINEAFSVVTMAAMKELDITRERVNINGGAIALGHPIGASGARILTTLVHSLNQQKKNIGLATLCIGGGEAVAMIVEAI